MSFLIGSTDQLSNVNKQTGDLQKNAASQLGNIDIMKLLFGPGMYDESFLGPIKKMYADQLKTGFAGAKESAGNLTGSGLSSYLGRFAQSAAVQQGGDLARVALTQRNAQQSLAAQLLTGVMGSPAGGVTNVYRPGLLDYAAQGASGLASGGAFNGLFK